MTKPLVKLDAWRLHPMPSGRLILIGLATGHPKLGGRRRPIHTSAVVSFDLTAGLAETLNSRYRLGHRLRRLVLGHDQEVLQVELGTLTAERSPGTIQWTVSEGDRVISTFESNDFYVVLNRLLDDNPTLEDLISSITPDNLHGIEEW